MPNKKFFQWVSGAHNNLSCSTSYYHPAPPLTARNLFLNPPDQRTNWLSAPPLLITLFPPHTEPTVSYRPTWPSSLYISLYKKRPFRCGRAALHQAKYGDFTSLLTLRRAHPREPQTGHTPQGTMSPQERSLTQTGKEEDPENSRKSFRWKELPDPSLKGWVDLDIYSIGQGLSGLGNDVGTVLT